jgi:hypothetical protein
MLGLLSIFGLLGTILILPILLIGLVLRIAFRIVLLPFEILGALFGIAIVGIVLLALGLGFTAVLGAVTLGGVLLSLAPLALFAIVIWALFRILRGRRGPHVTG